LNGSKYLPKVTKSLNSIYIRHHGSKEGQEEGKEGGSRPFGS